MDKVKANKHFAILIYYIVVILLYDYTEETIKPTNFMYSQIDNYIPFVKQMIIPYMSWYFYIAIALIYTGLYSKENFYKLNSFMFLGMMLCFLAYFKFPNGHYLRPYLTSEDIYSRLIKALYELDTPTNSAPSIHVVISIGIHMTLMECNRLNIYIKGLSLVLMISIIASTVMIKQHSILDVLYGAVLSISLYVLIFKVNFIQYAKVKKGIFVSNGNK